MNSISQDLFYKIRSRFTGLKLGKETGEITIDPSEAAFFDFDYMDGENPIGHVSISLAEPANMKVYYSTGITEGMDIAQREGWYNFLKELRQFAKRRLMSFDTRDIAKDNLDKRDYEFLVQNAQQAKSKSVGESIMSESSLYGTKTMSFQKLMDTRLIIKHSKAVMDDSQPGARARNISALFVENQEGERFKYPFIHLAGARAMQRHVANGGLPYDPIGESIIKMSEEIAQLKSFGNYVVRNDLMNSDTNGIVERSTAALDNLRETLSKLSKQGYYEQYKENFHAGQQLEVPQEVVEDFTEKFTVKNFKEDIKSVFPILYRLMKEHEASNEIGYDDIVEMTSPDELAEEDFEAVASDPFTKFEHWAMSLGETSAIQSSDDDEKSQAVRELQLLIANPLPAGIDGTNAIESLKGIINDPALERGIKAVSKEDSEKDVRAMVQGWLEENAPDVLDQLDFSGVAGEEEVEDPMQYANDSADADAIAYGQQESIEEAKGFAYDFDTEYESESAVASFEIGADGNPVITKVMLGRTDITKVVSEEDKAEIVSNIDLSDYEQGEEKLSYDNYLLLNLHIEYDISGEYRPATWGYHGGEPEEYPEIDGAQVSIVGDNGAMVEIDGSDLGPKGSEWIDDQIWADADRMKDDYNDYDDRNYDYESADTEQQEEPKQSMNVQEVAQFIHSFYDKNTKSFPKGPEGVCTMVGKKFGEQAEQIARKFVERMAPHQATEQNPELAELARIKKLSGM